MARHGKSDGEQNTDRLTCVGLAAASGALVTLVLLMVGLVVPRWAVAQGGGASLGLFDICAQVEYYDPFTGSSGQRTSCAYTHAPTCTVTICSTVPPDGALACDSYYLFHPGGFQASRPDLDGQTLGNYTVTLADPGMVFPGEGSCSAYHATKGLVLVAVIVCGLGFFCAPFTCCFYARGRRTLVASVVMYTLVAVCAIAAVAVFGGQVMNPATSVYGEAFWLAVAAAVVAGVTVPLVVFSPSRGKDELPPFGAGGYPYQNPASAGLFATHEARPDPPVGMASSNYPQPGNNYGKGKAAAGEPKV